MIVTRAPYRVSFFGGGSDLESFHHQWPGAVLSASISKFTYVSSHNFFDSDKIRVKYSKTETCERVDDIEHPILREVLRKFQTPGALEISTNGDVAAGTGLGSSSAFTVALLHNMHTRAGRFVTRQQLAEEACEIEISRLQEPIGKQDQFASAFGGLNVIQFPTTGHVTVEPVHLQKSLWKALEENLLMFFTGHSRAAGSILTEQHANMKDSQKTDLVRRMVDLVWIARESLHAGEFRRFGELLNLGWSLKQKLASGIVSEQIEAIYQRGLGAGAVGGKLLGAGGGGFILFYCEKEQQPEFRQAMSSYRELPFKFDQSGAQVMLVADEYWSQTR